MKFRTGFINVLCFVIVGIVLTIGGLNASTWEYWVIMLSMAGLEINLAFD